MPSIHASEDPPLGWLVPCLAVGDLQASLAFYAAFDLLPYGGDPAEGWAMLRNRAVEIHLFRGHIEKDLLNFRGGDLAAIRGALEERGLVVAKELGARSFILEDPDGREVFFDTSDEETRAYAAGQPLTGPVPAGGVHEGSGLDLGNLTWCLACADLGATTRFYGTLGLVTCGGEPEKGWAVVARPDHRPRPGRRLVATYLTLFGGRIPADTVNLRGGDVAALARTLAARGVDLGDGVQAGTDGAASLLLRDPDDRPVFLDTTPPERLYAPERSSG